MNPLHEQIRRHAHVDDDAFQVSRRVLHNHWLNNCGNGSLRDLLSTWKMRMSVVRRVRMRAEDIERSLRDHDRLLLACQDREETRAVALMKSMTLYGISEHKSEAHK